MMSYRYIYPINTGDNEMAKQVYKYKQVQIPEVAHKDIIKAHDLAKESGNKVRLADLWVHAAAWVLGQVENNGYAEVSEKGYEHEITD